MKKNYNIPQTEPLRYFSKNDIMDPPGGSTINATSDQMGGGLPAPARRGGIGSATL